MSSPTRCEDCELAAARLAIDAELGVSEWAAFIHLVPTCDGCREVWRLQGVLAPPVVPSPRPTRVSVAIDGERRSYVTVYVVAFQNKTPGEGVGGCDWRATREEVEAIEEEREGTDFYTQDDEHAIFEMEVPAGLTNDETTRLVDAGYIETLVEALRA